MPLDQITFGVEKYDRMMLAGHVAASTNLRKRHTQPEPEPGPPIRRQLKIEVTMRLRQTLSIAAQSTLTTAEWRVRQDSRTLPASNTNMK